jgi:hypothetical protein
VGAPKRYAIHYLVPFCDLRVNAEVEVGEGQAKLSDEPLDTLRAALKHRAIGLVGDVAVKELVGKL